MSQDSTAQTRFGGALETTQKRKRCRPAGDARSGSNRGRTRTKLAATKTVATADQIAESGRAAGITLNARSSACAGWSVAHTQITPSATTNRISKRTKTTNGTRRLILLKLTTAPEDTSSAEERREVRLESSVLQTPCLQAKAMKLANGLGVVPAPLHKDAERRRWYADGGDTCLVLTKSGELLEPVPAFGPTFYRVIAREVAFAEADDYAAKAWFPSRQKRWLRVGPTITLSLTTLPGFGRGITSRFLRRGQPGMVSFWSSSYHEAWH